VVRIGLLSVPVGLPFQRTLRWLFRDALRGEGACRAQAQEAIDSVAMIGRLFNLPRPPWPTVIDDKAWQSFKAPCLFLVGENEKIYSARAAIRRVKRVAPQVKAEIIPGCGHDLTMVQPELVFGKALAFLDERAGVTAAAA
jgi:pimeloyl-ACP methyl ester carboxylesterase